MQLTQKQAWLIDRYLRSVAVVADPSVDAAAVDRLLARLRRQIEGELARLDENSRTDEAVRDAILRVGPAEKAVQSLLTPKESPAPTAPKPATAAVPSSNARWLGVCDYYAERLQAPAWAVRTIVLLLGLGTGPLAWTAYGLVFLGLRLTGKLPGPPIRWGRLIGYPLLLGLVIGLLYAGARYVLIFAAYAMDTWLKKPMPPIGEWGWFIDEQHVMLVWAGLLIVPLACLGALPMAGGWDKTLRRFSQALAALYAIAICFGLASVIVGVVLQFAGELTGK